MVDTGGYALLDVATGRVREDHAPIVRMPWIILFNGWVETSSANIQNSLSASYDETALNRTWSFWWPGKTNLDAWFGVGKWTVKWYARVGVQTTAKNLDVKIRNLTAAADIQEFTDITDSTGGATEDVVKSFTSSLFPDSVARLALMIQKSGEASGTTYWQNGHQLVVEYTP